MKNKTFTTCAAMLFGMFILQAPAMAQTNPKLSDPEVASVAVVANQIDIDFAKIAKEKSKDQEVLKFANMMAKDHQSVIDQAVALVTKLKVTPKENATGKQMLADAEKTKKMLRSKAGKEFDKAYIDNEVAYHQGRNFGGGWLAYSGI
jgi:putative membrane protein